MRAFDEPAEQADRVIAPGEAAEPGVTIEKSNRACEAGDRLLVTGIGAVMMFLAAHPSVAPSGLRVFCSPFPRLGSLAWGYHSVRLLRRLVEQFFTATQGSTETNPDRLDPDERRSLKFKRLPAR